MFTRMQTGSTNSVREFAPKTASMRWKKAVKNLTQQTKRILGNDFFDCECRCPTSEARPLGFTRRIIWLCVTCGGIV